MTAGAPLSAKFLLVAALLGGLVLFVWSFLWYTALPFSNLGVHEFSSRALVEDVIGEAAPQRGIYMSPAGIFAAVNLDPDVPDRSAAMGLNLLVQALNYFAVAFVLAVLLFHSSFTGILARAVYAAIVGLAGGLAIHMSHWNWHGFPASYTVMELLSTVIAFFLAGLVIARATPRTSVD